MAEEKGGKTLPEVRKRKSGRGKRRENTAGIEKEEIQQRKKVGIDHGF